MKRLTERESLELCADMWDAMARENYARKSEYFKAHGIRGKKRPRRDCYACEYAEQKSKTPGFICHCCPIWNDKVLCTDDIATYDGWLYADPDDRPKYAKAIAELALAKLQELDDENG